MTINQVPQQKIRQKLDTPSKIAMIAIAFAGINTVTAFTVLPTMSRMGSVMEQIDYTLKMVPRFFAK